ncbi:MAG: aminotransferase class I/II-fold pyridoxal phosphate-dependent enzyme [Pseudomonadota bacterium]
MLAGASLGDTLAVLPDIVSTTAGGATTRRAALEAMNRHSINHLPLLNDDGGVAAVLDRKDIDNQILLSTPHMGDAERDFVEEAFRTNWIAPLGPNVDAFEQELAAYVGVGHAAAVSSGTAAIHLALHLLNVTAGDTVFCSTLTFAASANPIVYQGATPVFIDSDRESWNMCPAALERGLATARRLGKLPKAVIVVDLYGQSADMDAIVPLCDTYGVPIVEDAAESLGATYRGRASGTFGRLGIYSFNGNKIITTSGGGMLVSDDPALIDRARFLATQARDPAPHYQHTEIGFNYRMSNILAGVGRGQLAVLDERVAARRRVFETYRRELADVAGLAWMPEPDGSRSNRWLTTCTLDPGILPAREEVARRLADEFVEARPVWKPMHLQPVFADCTYYTANNESISDDLFDRGLCLPSGSNLTDDQLARTISALRSALAV